jgi:hypothetical protein
VPPPHPVARPCLLDPEPDGPAGFLRPGHELAYGVENYLELNIVFLFQFFELTGEIFVGCQYFPEPHKGSHDMNDGLNCDRRVIN